MKPPRDLPDDEIELTLLLRNNRLKRLRLAEGLTQKELGDRLDIGNQTIGAAEKFVNVSAAKLQRIADYFGVDKEWLFPPWAMGQFARTRVVKEVPKAGLLVSGREAMTRLMLPDPSKSLEQKELAEKIEMVLQTLSFREREVFKMRSALGGYDREWTYREIGKTFKVTMGRARQIYLNAYRKIRLSPRADTLREFVKEEENET